MLLVLLITSFIYAFDREEIPTDPVAYQSWKARVMDEESGSRRSLSPMSLSVDNDYVDVVMDELTGAFEQGGDPAGRSSFMKLTYYYPSVPWSYSIYKIDSHTPEQQNRVGPDCAALPSPDSTYYAPGNIIRTIWNNRHGVKIVQDLQCVSLGSVPGDNEQVQYETFFIPVDGDSHNCGCLLYYDTKLNSNDGAPISTSYGYSGFAEIFFADSVPSVWRAYEYGYPPSPGHLQALGILRGFSAVFPDVFWCGQWPLSYGNGWADSYWIADATGDFGWDTATMVKWYPRWVAPGDTLRYCTYYGIGELSEFLTMDHTPPTFVSDCAGVHPNPFTIDALITNGGATAASGVQVITNIEELGLEFAEGYEALIDIGDLAGYGGSVAPAWQIIIPEDMFGETVCYTIAVIFDGGDPIIDTFCIDIPELAPGPYGELIEPLPGTRSACPDQEIIIFFHTDNAIDETSVEFMVNGEIYGLDDPELRVEDSFLIYQPVYGFQNNVSYEWELVGFLDTIACPLENFTGDFIMDLEGPAAYNEYPPDDIVLSETEIPEFTVDLTEVQTEVDDASIEFEVNEVIYNTTDAALEWDGATLHFYPSVAEIVIEEGDSFHLCVNRADDLMPDYCEPNGLQDAPYCWDFMVNVIDLYIPDTAAYLGDNILIPIMIEDVDQFNITSFTIVIDLDSRVLTPSGIYAGSTVCGPWESSMEVTIEGDLVTITGSGPALTGGPVFLYLDCIVNPAGSEGAFSRMNFREATFNEGIISSRPVDGFMIVLWTNPEWLVDMLFSSFYTPTTVTLTFGVSSRGTDNYDPGLDLISLPSAWQLITYFPLNDYMRPHITKLQRDIRHSEGLPITWEAMVNVSPEGSPWTVRWFPEYLPDGKFEFFEEGGPIIDMNNNNTYSSEGDASIYIRYSHPDIGIEEISLQEGWNLISLPFIPPGDWTFQNLLPGVISCGFWYNPETRTYLATDYPEAGKGYWVYADGEINTRIAGMPVYEYSIFAYAGWNLIGVPYSTSGSVPGTGTFFGFNPETRMYESPAGDQLLMNHGYWYFAPSSGVLNANGESLPSE